MRTPPLHVPTALRRRSSLPTPRRSHAPFPNPDEKPPTASAGASRPTRMERRLATGRKRKLCRPPDAEVVPARGKRLRERESSSPAFSGVSVPSRPCGHPRKRGSWRQRPGPGPPRTRRALGGGDAPRPGAAGPALTRAAARAPGVRGAGRAPALLTDAVAPRSGPGPAARLSCLPPTTTVTNGIRATGGGRRRARGRGRSAVGRGG